MFDSVSHAVVGVLGIFARAVAGALNVVESGLRALLSGAGLSADVQTLLLIAMLALLLFAVMRLMTGRLRLALALTVILVLAHTLGRIGQGPLG